MKLQYTSCVQCYIVQLDYVFNPYTRPTKKDTKLRAQYPVSMKNY